MFCVVLLCGTSHHLELHSTTQLRFVFLRWWQQGGGSYALDCVDLILMFEVIEVAVVSINANF